MCLAIPGLIEDIDAWTGEFSRTGRVNFGGIVKRVNLSLVPDALEGDYVLVHVGVALQRIDAEEAARVFDLLRAMGDVEREIGARGDTR